MPRAPEYNRTDVLSAAADVFWQNGYEASSVQKLLDAMHINRGSLYTAFGDKETLFKSALDFYGNYIEQLIENLESNQDITAPLSPIYQLFETVFLVTDSVEKSKGCLIFNTITELSVTNPEISAYAAEKMQPVQRMFKNSLCRAKEQGMLSVDSDPDILTSAVMAFLAGLRVSCKQGVEDALLRKTITTVLNRLLI